MLYARRNPRFYILFYKTLQFKRTWRHIRQIDSYIPLVERFHYVHFTTDIRILSAQCIAWESRIPRKRLQGKSKETEDLFSTRTFRPFSLDVRVLHKFAYAKGSLCFGCCVFSCLPLPSLPSPDTENFHFTAKAIKEWNFPPIHTIPCTATNRRKEEIKVKSNFIFLTKLKFIGCAKRNTWEAFHWFFEK